METGRIDFDQGLEMDDIKKVVNRQIANQAEICRIVVILHPKL